MAKKVGKAFIPARLMADGPDASTPKQDFAGGDDRLWVVGTRPPETHLQALLEAAPGETPALTEEEVDNHHLITETAVHKALMQLTEFERTIIQLHFFGGKSLRQQEEVLKAMRADGAAVGTAKSYVDRSLKKAMVKLKGLLRDDVADIYNVTFDEE